MKTSCFISIILLPENLSTQNENRDRRRLRKIVEISSFKGFSDEIIVELV